MENGLTPVPFGMAGMSGNDSGARTLIPRTLSKKQKAAVVVRLLLSEGAELPLDTLEDRTQVELTAQMSRMRLIDRATLKSVVEEFADELEAVGLHFPSGIEGALSVLDGHISAATAARLRREAGIAAKGDPWERIAALEPERLVKVLEEESVEVGAVMLSKLNVSKAAELLGMVPGERARRLSYAISRTGSVEPETVKRIGLSLVGQLDAEPVTAFDDGPVARVGAILNSSRSMTRDEVLAGLDETDSDFAAEVRKTIFTFANVPARIPPREVPRILRAVDQAQLVVALAHAGRSPATEEAADFILENISKRMAEQLREEVTQTGQVSAAAGEEAMGAIIAEIRRLVDAGELVLIMEEEEE